MLGGRLVGERRHDPVLDGWREVQGLGAGLELARQRLGELVLLLHPVREAQFFSALEKMKTLPEVLGAPAYIRVEGEA